MGNTFLIILLILQIVLNKKFIIMIRNGFTIVLLMAFSLSLSLTSCGGVSFRLDGDTVYVVDSGDTSYVVAADSSETRVLAIDDFDAIDVSHAFEIIFSPQVAEGAVELTAPVNLFDCIKCEVDDGCLEVRYIRNVKIGMDTDRPMLRLSSLEKFKSIDISGASRMVSEDTLRLADVEIDISGASGMDVDLTADKLFFDISGASGVTVGGTCGELGMDVSGASHADMSALKAGYCDVECSGASKLSVWCEKEISIDCSGASKINVFGPGTITRQDVSGASNISRK